MKPPPFTYHRAESLEHALTLKARYGDAAKFLAGGQSLVPAMNMRLADPGVLIDLNPVRELAGIEQTEPGLRIGAMTRYVTLQRSAAVKQGAPLVFEALPHLAHPQIRTRGTIGGSLAHADPAAELPMLALVMGARLHVRSATRSRDVAAEQFFKTFFTTDLEPDEMLTAVSVPAPPARSGSCFLELSRRRGDYAMMGVAAVIGLDARGRCCDARLGFMNAGETPLLSRSVTALVGAVPEDGALREAAAAAARDDIAPADAVHTSAAYARQLARVLAERALREAAWRAKAGA